MSNIDLIKNPLDISKSDLPLFVFSDNLRSFVSLRIRTHTAGNYSHAMMMIEEGYFVSQDLTYHKVPVNRYMKPYIRLKFWQYQDLDDSIKTDIINLVECELKSHWFRKLYDFTGILGQALKLPFIQSNMQDYCSERVARCARLLPLHNITIPKHPSPACLNNLFMRISLFKVFGRYYQD